MNKIVNRSISVFLMVLLLMTTILFTSFAEQDVWDGEMPTKNELATYSGGSGTEEEPYLIATPEDLAQLSVNTNEISEYSNEKFFKQICDIVLNSPNVFEYDENDVIVDVDAEKTVLPWTPIGRSYSGWEFAFMGNFNGDGNVIKGIYIDTQSNYQGLFGYIDNGIVANVGVEDSYIKGENNIGGIAAENSGTITNSYNTGTISGTNKVGGVSGSNNNTVSNSYNTGVITGNEDVGGVVGSNKGTLTNSYNKGTVSGGEKVGGVVGYNQAIAKNCHNTGKVSARRVGAGGLVGYNEGIVADSYNIGLISGNNGVGGILGYNNNTVSSSYNIGTVSGEENIGGVVGYNDDGGTVTSFYYLDTSVENPSNDFGTVLSEEDMRAKESFVGFDFEDIWIIGEIDDYYYPTLRLYVSATVQVAAVDLNMQELDLFIGGEEQMILYISPVDASNKSVSWQTSDSSIATVSEEGLVKAHAVGNAVITVTTEDGGYVAECSITVLEEPTTEEPTTKEPTTEEPTTEEPTTEEPTTEEPTTEEPTTEEPTTEEPTTEEPTTEEPTTEKITWTAPSISIDENSGFATGLKADTKKALSAKDFVDSIEITGNGRVIIFDAKGNEIKEFTTSVIGTGTVIQIKDGNKVVDERIIVVKGDTDGDGKISAADARLALRNSANLETLSDAQIAAAAKMGAEKLSAADARKLLRVSAGLETI